ncbi:hypothetical protein RJ640_007799 [Escallonia rubra]|uniref:Chromo domain-containing protein n=1 Tax=Escallonia rubra TaxID=112253 RepID=A0AA88QSI6_9ASTE|nr:hypothetical protein RJ640_007799 [Escallonia rubra]
MLATMAALRSSYGECQRSLPSCWCGTGVIPLSWTDSSDDLPSDLDPDWVVVWDNDLVLLSSFSLLGLIYPLLICSLSVGDIFSCGCHSAMIALRGWKEHCRMIVGICWRTLLARGKSSATHDFLCAIKGHRVSGGIRAAVAQGTVASAKKIVWDSLLRKTMANTKERIDALEAWIQSMFKSDQDALGILKHGYRACSRACSSILEVNLEATDNARYAKNMDWEGKFQELQDRVEHHTRHTEVDILFFFMEWLKPWARTELNRRRVNNLNEAIITAESLSDYNSEPQRPPQRGNLSWSNGGKKPMGQAPNQSWGSKSSWASNSSTQQKSGVGFKAKPDTSTSGEVKKPAFRGCFLCQGPHVIANCPQRQMMNAFFDNIGEVQRGEQSGSQSRHPPTDEQTDAQDYEEEDVVGAFPQWCNAVTTQVGNPEESSTREKPKNMPPKKKGDVPGKGLMYVDIKVNRKAIRAMVDTGATHNYISSTEVERLGLTLEKGCGWVKAINSAAQPVTGIARSVLIKIGLYEGRTNFSVVIMDDFKRILGLEFLRDTKTTVMPCTNSLAMLGSKPCVIPTISSRAGERSISALQWQELLVEFNFMLEYRAGSTNSVADALSRSRTRSVKKIGKMAYKVDPPNWWSRQLHPVFHVSVLNPFYEDTTDPSRGQIRRPGIKPKAVGKRVAEAILNDRVITASRKHHSEYLVKWQGYMDEENTWERAADLSAYTDKIEAYHMQKLMRASTALVWENVTGCPLYPPSTTPPRPSCTAPPRPSNTRPCALASSSSLAPVKHSARTPNCSARARQKPTVKI